jgi:predicted enzyme related to lactoylglutathione lyase
VRVTGPAERLAAVVLTAADLDQAVKVYRDGFGLDLHIDDHEGDDLWTSGRHAATSWADGAFLHFALYQTKDGETTTGAQVAFRVADLTSAHARAVAAGVEVLHEPKPQPWGTSARYLDADGNVVELTQAP